MSGYFRAPGILDWSTPTITRINSCERIQRDREGTMQEFADLLDPGVIYEGLNQPNSRSLDHQQDPKGDDLFLLVGICLGRLLDPVTICHHLSTPSNNIWIHIYLTVVRYNLTNLIFFNTLYYPEIISNGAYMQSICAYTNAYWVQVVIRCYKIVLLSSLLSLIYPPHIFFNLHYSCHFCCIEIRCSTVTYVILPMNQADLIVSYSLSAGCTFAHVLFSLNITPLFSLIFSKFSWFPDESIYAIPPTSFFLRNSTLKLHQWSWIPLVKNHCPYVYVYTYACAAPVVNLRMLYPLCLTITYAQHPNICSSIILLYPASYCEYIV